LTAPAPTPFRKRGDGVQVAVRLTPGAARAGLDGVRVDAAGNPYLAARVAAPAESGRANTALIKLLAKLWRLPRGTITLTAGHRSRRKSLRIAGDPEALFARLERTLLDG
jgi:hypothetical protein